MHDTFLFKNISNHIEEVCRTSNITTLTYIEVDVHTNSHVDEVSLYEYLNEQIPMYCTNETQVIVNKTDVPELTAIIKSIEGTTSES